VLWCDWRESMRELEYNSCSLSRRTALSGTLNRSRIGVDGGAVPGPDPLERHL
jgi:hypothetical protein